LTFAARSASAAASWGRRRPPPGPRPSSCYNMTEGERNSKSLRGGGGKGYRNMERRRRGTLPLRGGHRRIVPWLLFVDDDRRRCRKRHLCYGDLLRSKVHAGHKKKAFRGKNPWTKKYLLVIQDGHRHTDSFVEKRSFFSLE
jgi:hypothetical protein